MTQDFLLSRNFLFFEPKLLWAERSFCDTNFLSKTSLGPCFLTNFFEPKFTFNLTLFFDGWSFCVRIYFWTQNFFWTRNFFLTRNFFFDPKLLFWPETYFFGSEINKIIRFFKFFFGKKSYHWRSPFSRSFQDII